MLAKTCCVQLLLFMFERDDILAMVRNAFPNGFYIFFLPLLFLFNVMFSAKNIT